MHPVYGARPLKRAIQSLIQNPLAVKLLQGDIASGQTVRISADDGESISELKIGDNINATPAILDGRIYIGAFNGKLYCLK